MAPAAVLVRRQARHHCSSCTRQPLQYPWNRVDQGRVSSSNRRGRMCAPSRRSSPMQRLTFALFVLVLAVSPLAQAEDWSKTYTISGKPDLRVETSDANIRVDTWDKNTIDVHIASDRYKFGDAGLRV